MEIVFVSLLHAERCQPYDGIVDAIRASEVRSGCRVWCIADHPVKCENFINYNDCSKGGDLLIKSTTLEIRKRWATEALLRTLAIYEFARSRKDLEWPIFFLDHDILVFSDLREVYKPFLSYDFCAPVYGAGTSAAYSVHSLECLNAGIEMFLSLIGSEPVLNDMVVWANMFRSGKWKVGNLLAPTEDGVFDMNIHRDENRYVMEPSTIPMWGPWTKKITWKDGHPYFTELVNNQLIQTHWIHCWGSYKLRTKELIEKAGL